MFKHVAVTFRKQTAPMYMSVKDLDEVMPLGMSKTEYVMEIRSDEFFADVKVAVHYNFWDMTNAIASCLMAGLKLIDGHEMVYHEVASQFRTNLGIDIFHGVSSDIASIVNTKMEYNNIPFYEVVITDGIGFYTAKSKDFVSYHIQEKDEIKLEFKISDRDGKVNVISQCFDILAFHSDSHGVVRYAQSEALHHLHKSKPEYGADWELLRAEWFGNPEVEKMPAYHSGGFISNADSFNYAAYPPPPYSMLWNVIVDLNDKRGWSREQVADWLETLDVDISFGSENEPD